MPPPSTRWYHSCLTHVEVHEGANSEFSQPHGGGVLLPHDGADFLAVRRHAAACRVRRRILLVDRLGGRGGGPWRGSSCVDTGQRRLSPRRTPVVVPRWPLGPM